MAPQIQCTWENLLPGTLILGTGDFTWDWILLCCRTSSRGHGDPQDTSQRTEDCRKGMETIERRIGDHRLDRQGIDNYIFGARDMDDVAGEF